jgi:histidinol-phosphate aminotransferase
MSALSCDPIELAAPGVRTLHPYQPGKPESELRRELGLREVVKLASNENPLGPPAVAVDALRGALPELARYPDGNAFELKRALGRRLDWPESGITLGNGSNDVLELIARTFLTPQREVLFSEYAFVVYPLVARAVGAVSRVATAHPVGHPMAYGHDLAALERLVGSATSLVFIANPNNPTGTWLPAAELEAFLEKLPDRVLVVLDEAYAEYVEHPDYPDALAWLRRFPNLIVTRTFSKAYGLAGLRVGYALSSPAIADLLNRVRQPFNVNSLAQAAACAALDDVEYLARSRAVNRSGLAQLRSGLQDLGFSALPSVGNFLCVDCGTEARPLFEALLRQGVIVRPIDNYGLPRHLRVSVGLEAENARFLEALARCR